MEPDRKQGRVAEPADEELKKHGDPLKPQVARAAGKTQAVQDEGEGRPPDGGKTGDDGSGGR